VSNAHGQDQKVGLVLSGGGAAGLAHIGVLKALEEYGIRIDYISGTSAGALVGSLYAVGFTPEQIESFILSDEFLVMTRGETLPQQEFLLRKEEDHAGMISLSLSKDSLLKKSLPTNFVSSSFLDFSMLKYLGIPSDGIHNDFDNLFVPFRCVASDVAQKKSVVFSKGNLNEAVRASMTFPFYLKPLEIEGNLLFDGGLYNNFPTDVMYNDFSPDYIIGSNVSYNAKPPQPDDLIGQLTNMLVFYSNFQLPCEEGVIIEPATEVGTFSFEEAKRAIQDGYNSAIMAMDSILPNLRTLSTKIEIQARRQEFLNQLNKEQPEISSVNVHSDRLRMRNVEKALLRSKKGEHITLEELEKRYYRLYASEQIDFMFPTLDLKPDSTYELNLSVRKARDIKLDVGGHLSSRPVNTGYFGLTYQTVGKILTSTKVESYFGKFYGSAKASVKLDLPAVLPFSTNAYFVLNRWDYFRSFATFFEDVQPSFLVQNELYAGVRFDMPIGNNMITSIDSRAIQIDDEYYQTESFTNKDTADVTHFDGASFKWSLTQNSLNRKQFATSGHYFRLGLRYVVGNEQSLSGSTSPTSYYFEKKHSWINLSIDYQSFLVDEPVFHLGLHGQMVFNSQSLFANYTASLLSMTEFSLVPDAKTYFLPEYRSPQFVGLGVNAIFTLKRKFDLRFDGYLYQPFVRLEVDDNGNQSYSKPFEGDIFMASTSLIYHSFFGPVRVTTNLFPNQTNPLTFQISLGYILFNDRAIR
jgi:NTE family protein